MCKNVGASIVYVLGGHFISIQFLFLAIYFNIMLLFPML